MFRKIFKTILVLSLCLGISLPTNAAVSVSDGSAFVTKAEFAADLNNLSNRMAQLENSLDAKIDSLVSSYLTRNGIWNGANQELTYNYWIDFAVYVSGKTYASSTITNGVGGFRGPTGTYYATKYNDHVQIPAAVNSDYVEHTVDRIDSTFCQSVNKSGLLYMTVSTYPISVIWSASNDKRCQLEIGSPSSQSSTNYMTTAEWQYDVGVVGKGRFFNNRITERVPKNDGTGIVFVVGYRIDKILTFVSKGDALYFKEYFYFKRNSLNGNVNTGNIGYATPYVGSMWLIEDCVVY